MRRLIFIICLIVLTLPCAWPAPARAQFSPQGLIGAMTRPLRSLLGRLHHFPRHHARPRHGAEPAQPSTAATEGVHFGNAGPAVWPTAYEDVVGYLFWPDDYSDSLRSRGFGVIADTLLQPPSERRPVEVATTGSANAGDADSEPNGACNDPADTAMTWPITNIGQSVQLNGAERGALARLQTAMAQALKNVKATCSDEISQTPGERLHALVQRLWAVRDAGIYVRDPLKEFYNSLSPEQKAKFNSQRNNTKDAQATGTNNQAGEKQEDKNAEAAKRQYQACAASSGESAERLLRQIARKVRPTKEQDAALKALRQTTNNMAKLLSPTCDPSVPADPLARLDAANNQLTRMNYAATSMEIALNGFYAQLSGVQKARFDGLGR